MSEDIWNEMVEKYDIHGYDNSCVIINYETLIELTEKAEKWDKAIAGRDYIILGIDEHEATQRKLEAIKTCIGELKKETEAGLFQTTKQAIYRDLEKILEAEG